MAAAMSRDREAIKQQGEMNRAMINAAVQAASAQQPVAAPPMAPQAPQMPPMPPMPPEGQGF
jgi:hypothetical protein